MHVSQDLLVVPCTSNIKCLYLKYKSQISDLSKVETELVGLSPDAL